MKALPLTSALLSALGTNEFTLTIVLVVFVMLTAILLLIIILLCASKSFRSFFFREAAAKRKKAAQKKKTAAVEQQAELEPVTAAIMDKPAVTTEADVQKQRTEAKPRASRRTRESKQEHDLFDTVLTVPLGGPIPNSYQAEIQEPRAAVKPSTRTAARRTTTARQSADAYDNIKTVAIPSTTPPRIAEESNKNTFTVTITRARSTSAPAANGAKRVASPSASKRAAAPAAEVKQKPTALSDKGKAKKK